MSKEHYEDFLETVLPKHISKARADILCAFKWASSPQGFDYWVEVCNNLDAIKRAKIAGGADNETS